MKLLATTAAALVGLGIWVQGPEISQAIADWRAAGAQEEGRLAEEERTAESAAHEEAGRHFAVLDLNVKMPDGRVVNLQECRLALWRVAWTDGGSYFDDPLAHDPERILLAIYVTPAYDLVSVSLDKYGPSVGTGRWAKLMLRNAFGLQALLDVVPEYPIPTGG